MIKKQEPQVLTKFMNFRPEIFMQPRLKLALPSEFNDLFDSQLRLSQKDFARLAVETGRDIDQLKYFAQRMSAVHILSLSALAADDLKSSHMWGLYANSGKGIAFEFDFIELKNFANYEPLSSFIEGFSNCSSNTEKIEYTNKNLTQNILNKIKIFNTFCITGEYPENGENQIRIIPKDTDCELAAFQIDLKAKSLDKIVPTNTHLLNKTLENPFFITMKYLKYCLFPVIYENDFTILKSKFSELWLSNPETRDLKLVSDFMTHKTKNWESEQEYRLLVPAFSSKVIAPIDAELHKKEVNFEDAINKLEQQVNAEMAFIKFEKEAKVTFTAVRSINGDPVLVPIAILPFPKKIYLGWDFDTDSKYGKENLALIKRYCNKHGIKHLYKLEKTVDYDDSQFKCGLNLVDA
jgi:hypothetical protein